MKIEAFSEGKNLDAPDANEDQFLVLPGRGYAVFDGVTDISGTLFDGMRSGRLASRIAAQAVAEVLFATTEPSSHPERIVERISSAFQASYAAHGLTAAVRADPARRFGTTLMLAADLGDTFRFVAIGDSGLRINGTETCVTDMALDRVTARVRVEACRLVTAAGGNAADRERIGRACAFYGIATPHPDMQPWLDDSARGQAHERSLAWCAAHLPAVPAADIRHMVDHGVSGQSRFQNSTASPLGYGILDGFDVPPALVQVIDRPRADIRTIELFTDGYFAPGPTPSLAAWEASFAEVERDDPEKLGRYPSVKGTSGRIRADDRTVVIVTL